MQSSPVDISTLFRLAMRRFPATVTIVTARWQETDFGMTATAVTSLSMDPPSLLVCVNRSNGFHPCIEDGDSFCINILREGHQEIASNFGGAKPPAERFTVGDWQTHDRAPYLSDALANIFCRKTALFTHTTHSILIGEATHLILQNDVAPLLYLDGQYAAVKPLPM